MKLIQLINNSHNIIIYGEVGSGKNLLLRKLLNSPNLLERKKRFVRRSQTLVKECQVQEYSTLLDDGMWKTIKTKEVLLKARVARHLDEWFFITTDEHKKSEFREIADLYIKTCGISKDLKYLKLKVKKGDEEWKTIVSITSNEITEVNEWKENRAKPLQTTEK